MHSSLWRQTMKPTAMKLAAPQQRGLGAWAVQSCSWRRSASRCQRSGSRRSRAAVAAGGWPACSSRSTWAQVFGVARGFILTLSLLCLPSMFACRSERMPALLQATTSDFAHVLPAGKGELLTAADATPRPPPSVPPGAWHASEPDVRAIAANHAAGWQRRLALPQLPATATPAVMSNASVLATAKSVAALPHPWLPMLLTGYPDGSG